MCKKENEIKVIENFKNNDIDKRKKALEQLICRIIKNIEENLSK